MTLLLLFSKHVMPETPDMNGILLQLWDGGLTDKLSNDCFLSQQERLADKILSEGLEQLDKRPEGKQAEVRQGTPAEV